MNSVSEGWLSPSELGQKIRLLRMKEGLSQEALGEAIEATGCSISGWENGTRYPDGFHRRRLAEKFGISEDELMMVPVEGQSEGKGFYRLRWACPLGAGKLIREELGKRRMTVTDLARKIGVRRETVYFWFRGKHIPLPETASRIEAALGLPEGSIAKGGNGNDDKDA